MRTLFPPTDYMTREAKGPGEEPFQSLRRTIHGSGEERNGAFMNFTSPARRKLHKNSWGWPVRHPGGNIAYFFFFDDTDIPLRRLLLADSLKKVTLTPYRASAWDESGVFTVRKEAMKKYQSFLHSLFSCMERWQHKNTDTNPCQTVLRASGEALIQSLSAFILEILCNARNGKGNSELFSACWITIYDRIY